MDSCEAETMSFRTISSKRQTFSPLYQSVPWFNHLSTRVGLLEELIPLALNLPLKLQVD
jgi:hypothetical protein